MSERDDGAVSGERFGSDELVKAKLDHTRPQFITVLGRKGSGKSHLAARLWETWAGDRLCIDPTGDAIVGDDAERISTPLPGSWPHHLEHEGRVSLRFVPDPGSVTYQDELDRAVGLAWMHPKDDAVLLWADEVGELTKANSTPPMMRRVLHQGRHRRISMVVCGPRPMDIDPLVISQADFVYVFSMPHPRDKERVAANIGVPPKTFAELVDGLGEYHYLRYDAREKELSEWPPLPARRPEPKSR